MTFIYLLSLNILSIGRSSTEPLKWTKECKIIFTENLKKKNRENHETTKKVKKRIRPRITLKDIS